MPFRFRLFLFAALSACAPTVLQAPPATGVPSSAGASAAPDAAVPQASGTSPLPSAPATMASPVIDERGFSTWKASFIDRAAGQGFDRAFVEAALSGVQPDMRIVTSDRGQPEFSRPVSDYIRAATSAARIEEGRRRLREITYFDDIERRTGAPGAILIGIWSQESAFGRIQGDLDVITAFATLAFDGRRRDFAETELLAALSILRDGKANRAQLRGSWAGAMGQTQFIPSSYLRLGVDEDQDGRVDLWGSAPDALATAAHLLESEGWRRGGSWAVPVVAPPGFDWSVLETERRSPAAWAELGVRRADGATWSAVDQGSEAVLLAPAGAGGPAFLAFPNHFVIRKYNNSMAYALAIGLLADAVLGRPTPAWPNEVPLSRSQRLNAQTALAQLGYLKGGVDGVIGSGTRSALRAWQKSVGLTADGYLTPDLAERLRQQAGLPSA